MSIEIGVFEMERRGMKGGLMGDIGKVGESEEERK